MAAASIGISSSSFLTSFFGAYAFTAFLSLLVDFLAADAAAFGLAATAFLAAAGAFGTEAAGVASCSFSSFYKSSARDFMRSSENFCLI